MIIRDIELREIFDSRGKSTIEASVITDGGRNFGAHNHKEASVPAGKSKGTREAITLPFSEANESLEKYFKPALLGKKFVAQKELDSAIIALDDSPNKQKIGGNVSLAVSVASARILAEENGLETWQFLNSSFFKKEDSTRRPAIFANFINGGEHAGNNLTFQEYLVIAEPENSYSETIHSLVFFFDSVGSFLRNKCGENVIPIGDEDGFAPNFENSLEPIKLLSDIASKIKSAKYKLGIDAAASSFFENGTYEFDGKTISAKELENIYAKIFHDFPIFHSIEDPFAENDHRGFLSIRTHFPDKLIIGDDLTVTNPEIIKTAIRDGEISGLIVKPNQIGTVTEACEAIKIARRSGVKIIISHRSGETEDAFIIKLAKACGADGVKIGVPQNERVSKYNELVRLYD